MICATAVTISVRVDFVMDTGLRFQFAEVQK